MTPQGTSSTVYPPRRRRCIAFVATVVSRFHTDDLKIAQCTHTVARPLWYLTAIRSDAAHVTNLSRNNRRAARRTRVVSPGVVTRLYRRPQTTCKKVTATKTSTNETWTACHVVVVSDRFRARLFLTFRTANTRAMHSHKAVAQRNELARMELSKDDNEIEQSWKFCFRKIYYTNVRLK